jgi:hypothetical protein
LNRGALLSHPLPPAEVLAALPARYAWSRAGKAGGVVVDLQSGHTFALNATALHILERLVSCPRERVLAQVAGDFGLSATVASEAIAAVLAALDTPGVTSSVPADDFPYKRVGDEYVLYHRATPLLRVNGDGTLAHLTEARGAGLPLAHLLRLASPKILQARGLVVLHAAASGGGNGEALVVFSGRSGAGKSTTSRLLAEAREAAPFADDLLVLSSGEGPPRARAGAEAAIYRWCDDTGRTLLARPDAPIELGGLCAAASDPAAALHPLDRLIFVAAERRSGTALVLHALSPDEAMLELMEAVFLGATAPPAVREFLAACAALAGAVPMARAVVPEGLTALQAALARDLVPYISKITSKR